MLDVLIVDDDPLAAEVIAAVATRRPGARARSAGDGRAAGRLVAAAERLPTLIILDLNMPDCDGIELIDMLVAGGYRGPLVILSAAQPVVLKAAALLVEARGLDLVAALRKPLDIPRLEAILDDIEATARLTAG